MRLATSLPQGSPIRQTNVGNQERVNAPRSKVVLGTTSNTYPISLSLCHPLPFPQIKVPCALLVPDHPVDSLTQQVGAVCEVGADGEMRFG